MRTLVTALVTPVACLALMTGCSQEPEAIANEETPRLSRQEFVDQANTLCRKSEREAEALGRRLEGRRPAAVREAVREQLVPNFRKLVSDLRALGAPPRVRRELEPVLADTDRIISFIAEDPTRYAEGDLLFVTVNQDLNALGLTDCGS